MKKITILIMTFFIFTSLQGCSPSSVDSSERFSLSSNESSTLDDPNYKYKIKGRIVRSITNESICSAEVCIEGTNICALTNVEGYYLLYAPWGTYQLNITHYQHQFKGKTVNIDVSKNITDATILVTELEWVD